MNFFKISLVIFSILLSAAILLLVTGVISFPGWSPDSSGNSEKVEAPSGIAASRQLHDRTFEAGQAFLKNSLPIVENIQSHSRLRAEADALLNAHRLLQISDSIRNLANTTRSDIQCNDDIFQGKVQKGETIASILENGSSGKIQHYVNAAARVFSLRSFRAGQPYTIITDPVSGRVKRFEYEVNESKRLVVEGYDDPDARMEDIEYTLLLETAEAVINENLFQAVADIGESPQLALRLVDLFGSEINFIKDIQPGDSFAVLIEKRYRDGEDRGYGRILAARFTCKGKTYEAFLYRDAEGKLQHYNGKGENLHKTLLQSPLAVTRLTSRFTHSRKHPILGFSRPHLGVDYGAPTGTPVKAVGNASVVKRGWAGGYGNQIILSHGSGLESLYSHLSGFAPGLKTGQKVRQGQVIGFVGSTGLSTGPHLDFRLRKNGKFINPATAINPRGLPVPQRAMSSFNHMVKLERSWLDGASLPSDYTADKIVPSAIKIAQNSPEIKKTSAKKKSTIRKAKANSVTRKKRRS